MLRIDRRLRGIERAIQNQPFQELLSNFRQELLTLELNYERLRYAIYVTDYRRRLEIIATLSMTIDDLLAPQPHQQITAEHAGRGNMGASATATLAQSSSNSILSSRSTNSRREAKKRFNIDKGKLNHLLSCEFTVRAIAREGLLGERLHYNTMHNFMTRNDMASVGERYTDLSDKSLLELSGEISNGSPNSGSREMVAHLRNRNPPIQIQRDRCVRLLAQSDPVGTARRWAQAIHRRQYSAPTPSSLWHLDSNHALIRLAKYLFLNLFNLTRHIKNLSPLFSVARLS